MAFRHSQNTYRNKLTRIQPRLPMSFAIEIPPELDPRHKPLRAGPEQKSAFSKPKNARILSIECPPKSQMFTDVCRPVFSPISTHVLTAPGKSKCAGGHFRAFGFSATRQNLSLRFSRSHLPRELRCTAVAPVKISVQPLTNEEWMVTVDSVVTTKHRVRASDADVKRFGRGASAEELLTASFRFLLEREPNTSILPSFHLPLIGRYFPEFETEIRRYLASTKEV